MDSSIIGAVLADTLHRGILMLSLELCEPGATFPECLAPVCEFRVQRALPFSPVFM